MRILEPEVMMSLEEVYAYDKLVLKYLTILHNGFIETVINFSPPVGKFLDVGSGTGRIAIGVAEYNPEATIEAIDLSENMRIVAMDNAAQKGVSDRVNFSITDAKNLPFEDESFDCVTCHNTLHHLANPLDVVKEIKRVVKKDGAILIRDLKRISGFCIPFHVNIFGLPYNKLMKEEYRDSIKAALSEKEWKEMFNASEISGTRLTTQFLTHQSIERPASNRRKNYSEIPTPFHLKPFKNMYVSKP